MSGGGYDFQEYPPLPRGVLVMRILKELVIKQFGLLLAKGGGTDGNIGKKPQDAEMAPTARKKLRTSGKTNPGQKNAEVEGASSGKDGKKKRRQERTLRRAVCSCTQELVNSIEGKG